MHNMHNARDGEYRVVSVIRYSSRLGMSEMRFGEDANASMILKSTTGKQSNGQKKEKTVKNN